MNKGLKVYVLFLLTTICAISAYCDGDVGIRTSVSNVIQAISQGRRSMVEYVMEFGYQYYKNPHYKSMSSAVSNNFEEVFSNFDRYAPDSISRLVLLSSAWAYDQNYYFQSLSNALELASQNVITAKEFKWVRTMSDNIEFLSYLSNEYMKPSVSNLVVKMMSVTGETNYCHRILSGEAKRDVQKILDSMAEPIKDVTQQSTP
jgi:hypothetical protein